ncbi:NAD(P)/FAD-dependent oxidoreductase [Natronorubrum daqingense]|uniref:FAD-dependent oxidoreductase n=1 Tax=Natronorubrum daqingense TaxID=588898 RepID=A0A1N7ESP1_9EURY|nr:FAD-dependent oxidoreductase [Natronorubrum daqingense]APX97743.1 FAD-dependent oxidoreductase [Natronorubrum daqingense]SIR91044.1 glycine oxidase [Natronorubrum daqingense]
MCANADHALERVVIVGAGIGGCHAARELASDHDVTLLESSDVASGATGLSAGIVAPTLFYGDLPDVARHANEFVREFDGTDAFSFTQRHRLDFVSAEEAPDARETVRELAGAGFDVTYLERSRLSSEFPRVDPPQDGGAILYEDTGWVDPYTYANALRSDAQSRGASLETGVEVTEIVTENGRVTGVDTTGSRYEADAVVVAAGWRTSDLLPEGFSLPIRPYRTQCVVLEPAEPLDESAPIGRIGSEHLYFRPEHNGDLLVGGAHETVSDPLAASSDADESFTRQVADVVPSVLSGFDDAGFVNGWAGIDVATPDTRPIVDQPPAAPDGLVVSTGFNGLGIMTSPVVGPTVRERLTGERAPFSTAPFRADRFDVSGSSFAYTSTSEL